MQDSKKIGLVVTGASGSLLGLHAMKLMQALKESGQPLEIHLLVTAGGETTAKLELTEAQFNELKACADHCHDDHNLAASIASGSNPLDGLLFAPCSIRSLAAIAYCQTDRLCIRAADVMLKERRKLVLAVRETPLHLGHIQAMEQVTRMGGIIAPPVPAFYLKPESIETMLEQSAARLLSQLDMDVSSILQRWS
ncbi:UbiX family flavin prenyltransferase [uncultured Cohaesibacter sp.]|uniref:UbiX family flavin prenyltransferase n=1 Tax=uncultured Cohaesibacter sp. TaxID=1002546 RepID=UPI002AA6EE33|nr:UbiX family flavin prenyltransferase [uncultured Cohaesibacter sp.]